MTHQCITREACQSAESGQGSSPAPLFVKPTAMVTVQTYVCRLYEHQDIFEKVVVFVILINILLAFIQSDYNYIFFANSGMNFAQ